MLKGKKTIYLSDVRITYLLKPKFLYPDRKTVAFTKNYNLEKMYILSFSETVWF